MRHSRPTISYKQNMCQLKLSLFIQGLMALLCRSNGQTVKNLDKTSMVAMQSQDVGGIASDTSVNGHKLATASALCRVWRRNFGKPNDPSQPEPVTQHVCARVGSWPPA